MTKIQKKTLEIVSKSGFTFKGDAHFSSHAQAVRALNGLVNMGLLVERRDGQYCEYIAA